MEEAGMEGYGKRVLVVDDDHHARFYMGSILEREGYNVVPACNGITALNELSQRHFDVVITDDRMPYLSVTDFLAQVHTRHPHVPVILASATGEAPRAQAENRPALRFHSKPYDPSRVLAAVRSAARAIDAAGSDSLATLQ
jgi:DNA-binding NtrC family response regulator